MKISKNCIKGGGTSEISARGFDELTERSDVNLNKQRALYSEVPANSVTYDMKNLEE